jgi:hypothetical protein
MMRWRRAASWLVPVLLCAALYWITLRIWFLQDDFAWLGLRLSVYSGRDLLYALFSPMAQGTIRPWSERGFFLLFSALFGLDALPYRIWILATQLANVWLLSQLSFRLTGSHWVAALAPALWIANPGLAVALSWISTYNQILYSFFLLASLLLFVRYTQTGHRRYWIGQWCTFVLGFGALELNFLYPALAAAYALCCARRYLRKTVPLFVVSGLYVALHQWAAPKPASGVYAMHFDARILQTLATYWAWAVGPSRLTHFRSVPAWFVVFSTTVLSLALLGFALWKLWRREWLAAFLPAWFVVLLAPLLPLRDHITDYYLNLPSAGLAILGAWGAVSLVDRWRWAGGLLAAALCALYLGAAIPTCRGLTHWYFERARRAEILVLGVESARQKHPGQMILLTGVQNDLFWTGVMDRPFRLVGAPDTYLVPGSEALIEPHPDIANIADYILPEAAVRRALDRNMAQVYQVGGPQLRNITRSYREEVASKWKPELPRRVDVGQALFADQLGPTWYPIEGGYRWMPRQATIRLGGPKTPRDRLYISGFCPADQLRSGPLHLQIRVDGIALPALTVTNANIESDFVVPLPLQLVGKEAVELSLEVDRTMRPPGEERELGMAFGTFAIR